MAAGQNSQVAKIAANVKASQPPSILRRLSM